jgi:hypothetical protein
VGAETAGEILDAVDALAATLCDDLAGAELEASSLYGTCWVRHVDGAVHDSTIAAG